VKLGAAGAPGAGLVAALAADRERLKELFIVSEVAVLSDSEAAQLQREANGRESFSLDGKFGRVSLKPPLVMLGERAGGVKCERCWSYFDDRGDPRLCPRCRAVVRV
ncbi:MAG: hypothetical protein WA005_07515, partial [Candidatus Binataceae bacterium]